MKYEITDDGKVMVMKITDPKYPDYPMHQYCAIGRSTPWPLPKVHVGWKDPVRNRLDYLDPKKDDYHHDQLGYAP